MLNQLFFPPTKHIFKRVCLSQSLKFYLNERNPILLGILGSRRLKNTSE